MNAEHIIPIGHQQRKVEKTPVSELQLPVEGLTFALDQGVLDGLYNVRPCKYECSWQTALPETGTRLIKAVRYAQSIGSSTAKLEVCLPDSRIAHYFLKTFTGGSAESKCRGEFAALEAIESSVPGLAPKPRAHGALKDAAADSHFLLEDFFQIQMQPAPDSALAASLAKLHLQSRSPSGEFGFHTRSWHGDIDQNVGRWDKSWAVIFHGHLSHIMDLVLLKAERLTVDGDEFRSICDLILEHVLPNLLNPLQEDGRSIKPSLVHGDCWDGNSAIDQSGHTRLFDVCSFYGHNEYDTGNWRAPRHRVSAPAYLASYQKILPPSEPVEDWGARQLLYSLCFNMGNVINIPGSEQGPVVHEDMVSLCEMFCPQELRASEAG